MPSHQDVTWMQQALELAKKGEGRVEPNPMVGCLLVKDGRVIGEGYHEKWGEGHAEVQAIASATESTDGATAYVTLEPCCFYGKTPPCTNALIEANVARVVVSHLDPNPQISGAGMKQLADAGIEVESGVLQHEAANVLAPYLKRLVAGLPWIIAKWAMTLDGKIATHTRNSQWISNETSRAIVHQLRGRVDGIMVGSKTAQLDDPMLNARPPGPRTATRIIVDSCARLSSQSKLCQTARAFPVLVACGPDASDEDTRRLENMGCGVWQSLTGDRNQRLMELLEELAHRGLTNILVEGGGGLLGSLNDMEQIDETHVFIGPKLVGGSDAISPVAGKGHAMMRNAFSVRLESVQQLDHDVYVVGRRQ